jgi:hypothetical protein
VPCDVGATVDRGRALLLACDVMVCMPKLCLRPLSHATSHAGNGGWEGRGHGQKEDMEVGTEVAKMSQVPWVCEV